MWPDHFPAYLRKKRWLFVAGLVIIIGIVLLYGVMLSKEHSVSNLYVIPAGTFSPAPAAETTFAYPPGMVIYSFGPATLRPQDVGLNTTEELNSRLQKIMDDSDRELDRYYYPNGSVIGFGYDLFGTMDVQIYKEQGINQSTVDEIYRIIERNGEKNGIKNVPCKFLSMGMIHLDTGKNPAKPNVSAGIAALPTAAWRDAYGTQGLPDEKTAIRAVQDANPDLFAYPSGTFPVKAIITQRTPGGWYVAFIVEGSGVPIVSARCYYVGNDRTVRETGNISHSIMVMPQDFSPERCG